MSETIVIVDDNDAFRGHAKALLGRRYEVIGEAGDGETGLHAVRRLAPDIALLDVQLPDTNGFALAERLREDGLGTAIVLTSTRDECDYASAVGRCGACGFIPKGELSIEALGALLDGLE